MPLIGFYLQTAVGGIALSRAFWARFAAIDNVVAIKVAPFNRYRTLDVVRAVRESGRAGEVALYTGNDDNIVVDLLNGFSGGLLGHWAVWTRSAVALLERVKKSTGVPPDLLELADQTTDANAALFDAANGFLGCIAGLHEILVRQGLLAGRWCLNPDEALSPGQMGEIDRVCGAYPWLNDDEFVRANLDSWLA